jgi:signal transduction histidine kinase
MARRLLFTLLLLGVANLWGSAHPHKNVLVLVSDESNLPAVATAMDALRTEFEKDDPAAISLFTEYLDLNRFESPDYQTGILRWDQKKYRSVPLDLIICVTLPALRLVLAQRDQLWPGVPLTFMGIEPEDLAGVKLPSDIVGEVLEADYEGTVRLAMRLLPDTKHVAVVSGSAIRDRKADQQMISIVSHVQPGIDTIDLGGLSFEDLERRLSSLPKETVVMWTEITQDRNGRRFVPRDALAALVSRTNAPVFGAYGTYMATGIVGGDLTDFRVAGHDAAVLGKQILYEGTQAGVPTVRSGGNQIKLDWRQLRKWGIPDERIPASSEVLFRTPSLWEEHRIAIVLIASFVVIQSVLLLLLFAERRRLAVVRRELVHLNTGLIRAQEEERARIARELHDDLGQQLALFSIELDQMRAQAQDDSVEQALGSLSEKAAAVAADVHVIAHGLHPSKLDHLGLLPAVREFCREVELRNGVDVEVTTDDWPTQLSKNITLSLYRIVQEALQNVVRHSDAHRAGLQFAGRKHEVSLKITDDGRGFDPSAVPEGRGLGLAGMRERLRAVQGRIKVQSKPGAGTTVEVLIPLLESMPGETAASSA